MRHFFKGLFAVRATFSRDFLVDCATFPRDFSLRKYKFVGGKQNFRRTFGEKASKKHLPTRRKETASHADDFCVSPRQILCLQVVDIHLQVVDVHLQVVDAHLRVVDREFAAAKQRKCRIGQENQCGDSGIYSSEIPPQSRDVSLTRWNRRSRFAGTHS